MYKVILRGSIYKDHIIFEYREYGPALDQYCKMCIMAAEMLSLVTGQIETILVMVINGCDKRMKILIMES